MPTVPYKDPYFMPKNTFKPKPREYFAARTTYKLPEHLKEKVKKIQATPQPRFDERRYIICCYNFGSKEQRDLANFILSISPPRRIKYGTNSTWLVQRPEGFTDTYHLNPHTKDRLLPLIFEAIENGTL